MALKPNLYALVVGINEYRYPVFPLYGCVHDAQAVAEYLNSQSDFEVQLQLLLNEKATRQNIIETFIQHLGQAQPNDTVVFYFSGHGAQEAADSSIWRFESDQKLEGLVCYDSIPNETGPFRLLADKELRYLIRQVTHGIMGSGQKPAGLPHVVTIFDCCHSGDNTRSSYISKVSNRFHERKFKPAAIARMSTILPVRNWSDFCFKDQFSPEVFKVRPLSEILPEGEHIQLAACQSNESAYESEGSGVFTSNLLDFLKRCEGAISYYDLRSRLKHFIQNQFDQSPQIYESGSGAQIYRPFLGRNVENRPVSGNLTLNPELGWIMDLGAIHGVSNQIREISIVDASGKTVATGFPERISAAYTVVGFDAQELEKLQPLDFLQLKAVVPHFLSAPVTVFIDNLDQDEASTAGLIKHIGTHTPNLIVTERQEQSKYEVLIYGGRYIITRTGYPLKPLVFPCVVGSPDAIPLTTSYLKHIAQWEYVKELHNSEGNLLENEAIEMEFFQSLQGKLNPLPLQNDLLELPLVESGAGNFGGAMRIKVRNRSKKTLFVSILYLSTDFAVEGGLFPTYVQRLEAVSSELADGGQVWTFEGNDIPLQLERAIMVYNWPVSESYLKVIISTTEFDMHLLQQGPLPDPADWAEQYRSPKGLVLRKDSNADADRWNTRLITLRMSNPFYNKPKRSNLKKWLESEAGQLILNTYFKPAGPFGGQMQLKEGIRYWESAEEKGLWFDIKLMLANWIARKSRDKKYKDMLQRFPDSPRIVSEGDSWFQYPHPKVLDIIDYIAQKYPVKSLDAGGDELQGYYRQAEYLQAVVEENADYLLLSGGGNDILGPNIQRFLNENTEEKQEGKSPERFLNEEFDKELKKLTGIFEDIFCKVAEKRPGIKIVVHGYDYIFPDHRNGWYGQYVQEKIPRPADQKALADYLIDRFNAALAEIVQGYDYVWYIDLRNTVPPDRWYDEIHPDSIGFSLVAEKFFGILDEWNA